MNYVSIEKAVTIRNIEIVPRSIYLNNSIPNKGGLIIKIEAVVTSNQSRSVLDNWFVRGTGDKINDLFTDRELNNLYEVDIDLYTHSSTKILCRDGQIYSYTALITHNSITDLTISIMRDFINKPIEVNVFINLIKTLDAWWS